MAALSPARRQVERLTQRKRRYSCARAVIRKSKVQLQPKLEIVWGSSDARFGLSLLSIESDRRWVLLVVDIFRQRVFNAAQLNASVEST